MGYEVEVSGCGRNYGVVGMVLLGVVGRWGRVRVFRIRWGDYVYEGFRWEVE